MVHHNISFSLSLKPEGLLKTRIERKFVYADFCSQHPAPV